MKSISASYWNDFQSILLKVEKCCQKLDIEFYIIGALAKELWFKQQKVIARGTRDIDLAIFIRDENQFLQLKELLIHNYDFRSIKENDLTLLTPDGTQVDIIPFGNLEIEDGTIVQRQSQKRIKVNGLQEVYLNSIEEVRLLEGKSYKVATLPGIFLLKLISYDDRPEHRFNDPEDCMSIIQHFDKLQSDLIFDHHNDLFDEKSSNDSFLLKTASRVIGREMQKILNTNADLKTRIVRILENHITSGKRSRFVISMAKSSNNEVQFCIDCLKEILKGIRENT